MFQNGLNNGGPAGLIYGFLFTWIGSAIQALVMAEMASMLVVLGHTLVERANQIGFRLLAANTIGRQSRVHVL